MFNHGGVTINEKHCFSDFGLYVKEYHISPPEIQMQSLNIPGRNGKIDLTTALTGDPTYDNREIEIVLNGKKPAADWPAFMSDFMNQFHGQSVKLVFDDDPQFYYQGRAIVNDDYKKGTEVASFSILVDAEPFKYDLMDSAEDWLWDPFSFEYGVIREYAGIVVEGERSLMVVGSRMPVVPDIIVSAEMTVEYSGKLYALKKGQNKVYDIVIRNGESRLVFKGTGNVTVKYRGGSL